MQQQGKVTALCLSEQKGTQKTPVPEAVFREDWGIEGDAHAGHWHRQVSLLPKEQIDRFREKGLKLADGAFGENIVTEGIDLKALPVGVRLRIGEVQLEVTQIGKACHTQCAIRKATGDCIMPREGIFAKVLRGGRVKPGAAIIVLPPDPERPYTAAVITLSDRCATGRREDESGPAIRAILERQGIEVLEQLLLPDGKEQLEAELIRLSDQRQVDVIFTTGGTGFSARDLTPEATMDVCDRMTPGIPEAIRAYSMTITPRAMLSRQTAGIRGRTLIINLPGSPKACREDLDVVLPALPHGLDVLRGNPGE